MEKFFHFVFKSDGKIIQFQVQEIMLKSSQKCGVGDYNNSLSLMTMNSCVIWISSAGISILKSHF